MQEASFGDASAVRRTVRFKGEAGKFYRLSIMDQSSWSAETHYIGGYLVCLRTLGGECPACDKGIRKSQRFGNNIAMYLLDMNGMAVNPVQFQITFWPFGPDVWTRMSNLFSKIKAARPEVQFPQYERDLLMECTEAKFQKFQIDLSDDAPLWRQDQNLFNSVQKAYSERKVDLKMELGKTVTAQEMLRAMNDPNNAPRDNNDGNQRGRRGQGGFGQQQAPIPADPAQVFGGAGVAAASILPGFAAPAPQQYAPAPQQYAPAPQQYAPAPQQYAPAPVLQPQIVQQAGPTISFPGPVAAPAFAVPVAQPAFMAPTDGHAMAGNAVISAPPEAGDNLMKSQALEVEVSQVAQQLATLPPMEQRGNPVQAPQLMPPIVVQPGMGSGLPTVTPQPAKAHSQEFEALTAKIKARRTGG